MMIIRSSKKNDAMMLFGYIFLWVMVIAMAPDEPYLIFILMLFVSLCFLRILVCYGRTLIMDEQGCTVCFLLIKKKYLWRELKVKRIEDFSLGSDRYESGVVFSKRFIRKPTWYSASSYCLLAHPFSFFFVYFKMPPKVLPEGKTYGKFKTALETWEPTEDFPVYAVDEKEFLTQMKEWGVELEDTRRKYRRRYY